MQYQIKRCTAPCVGLVTSSDYQEQVDQCLHFLQGKSESVIQQCVQKMQVASQQQHYEQAARYRDKMKRLRALQANQSMLKDGGNSDVICVVLVVINKGAGYYACSFCAIRSNVIRSQEFLFKASCSRFK